MPLWVALGGLGTWITPSGMLGLACALILLTPRGHHPLPGRFWFNLGQLALIVVALWSVFWIVIRLLGAVQYGYVPGEWTTSMVSFQLDRAPIVLPRPWVLTVPAWAYLAVAIVWVALMATAFVRLDGWSWRMVSAGGTYRRGSPTSPAAVGSAPAGDERLER